MLKAFNGFFIFQGFLFVFAFVSFSFLYGQCATSLLIKLWFLGILVKCIKCHCFFLNFHLLAFVIWKYLESNKELLNVRLLTSRKEWYLEYSINCKIIKGSKALKQIAKVFPVTKLLYRLIYIYIHALYTHGRAPWNWLKALREFKGGYFDFPSVALYFVGYALKKIDKLNY